MAGEVLKGSQVIKSWLLRSRSGNEPVVGIEVLSGLPHDMEHHRELARQRYGGALEAETLLEHQSPGAQRAGRAHPGQDHGCGLVKQRAHPFVSPPRDMAIVVHFADWNLRGVSPTQAPTSRACLKLAGDSMAAT